MQAEQRTSTCNEHYDLISVLYHLLEGAWKYDGYCKEAEKAGDQALAQLFRDAQRDACILAKRAKALLRDRLGPGSIGK